MFSSSFPCLLAGGKTRYDLILAVLLGPGYLHAGELHMGPCASSRREASSNLELALGREY